jgi:hypothetical protein
MLTPLVSCCAGLGLAVSVVGQTAAPGQKSTAAEPIVSETSFGKGVPGLPPKEGVEFKAKPTVKADGANARIEFEVNQATDVTVEIVDATGKSVVRHLAAGLLGPHAPEPLVKDSLKQSLVWDRKDDDGKPVTGPCQVRVGLGMGVQKTGMHAMWGWRVGTPMPGVPVNPLYVAFPRDMAVGPDGNIYLATSYVFNWYKTLFMRVLVLDSEGRYLREIYPPAADRVANESCGLKTLQLADGQRIPRTVDDRNMFHNKLPWARRMVITPDGKSLLLASNDRSLTRLDTDGTVVGEPVPLPPGKELQLPSGQIWASGVNYMSMAMSPDGKTLYVLGSTEKGGKGATVIHKMAPDGKSGSSVFFGSEQDGPRKLAGPTGLAVDSKGKVYIADCLSHRVVVVKPDGALDREISYEKPFAVAIGPKDELYVLRAEILPRMHKDLLADNKGLDVSTPRLLSRLSPDGKEIASFPLALKSPASPTDKGGDPMAFFGMTVVVKDGKSTVWIGGRIAMDGIWNMYGIQRVADEGGKLVDAGYLDGSKEYVAFRTINPNPFAARPAPVDVRGAMGMDFPVTAKWGGFTYKFEYPKNMFSPDVKKVAFVRRFDAQNKEAPFPALGDQKWPEIPFMIGDRNNGSMMMNYQNELLVQCMKGAPEGKGDQVGVSSHFPLSGVDRVLPDGTTQVGYIYGLEGYGGGTRMYRVDRKGSVYINSHLLPPGRFAPVELEKALGGKITKETSPYSAACGAILKFAPSGGGFAWDKTGQKVKDPEPTTGDLIRSPTAAWDTYRSTWRAACEGIEWAYIGISPFMSCWFASCMCCGDNFDLDPYARVLVPDAYRMCVQVLDTNGNLLLRFGRYGNWDDTQKGIAFGRPRVVRSVGEKIHVDDPQNNMTTILDVVYTAKETVEAP